MKNFRMLIMLFAVLTMIAFPILAEEDENLEDMPTTVDETANSSEPEPNLPEVKKETPGYFGNVNIWAGYTTLSLSAVNNSIKALPAISSDPVIKEITAGYVLGLDLGFSPIKELPVSLGLRFELIGAGEGSFSDSNSLNGDSYYYTLNATLVPLMAGVSYTYDIPAIPVSISADVYGGYAITSANSTLKTTVSSVVSEITVPYNGGGFAMDLGCRINYQINEPMSAGFTLGYRIADISELTAAKSAGTVNKNDKFQDGKTVPFDFSGLNIGLSVNMKY
jgi:hypothetical protein